MNSKNMIYPSQLSQDQIVLKLLNNKTDGFFVDIGCAEPIKLSNSYAMEKYFNWRGIGVDILDADDETGSWKIIRPQTHHVVKDALQINYEELFKKYNCPEEIDYLSLDLEPPELTLECLFKIPFQKYKFKVITFETDEYRPNGEHRRDVSRSYLQKYGYRLYTSLNLQDDIYVHADSFGIT